MNRRRITTALAGILLAAVSMAATEVDFSYAPAGAENRFFGFDKAETYDVAIKVSDRSLNGSKVTGLRVALPGGDAVSDAKGWLSTDLKLTKVNGKYVNDPDIAVETATVTDGVLTLTFSEPYTVTGEFYAGYSFTVNQLDETTGKPVSVTDGDASDGLYMHSSRTKLKWGNAVEQAEGVSTLAVLLNGQFGDNSASFALSKSLFGSIEDDVVAAVKLTNHGLNPVNSVSYSYSVGDREGTGSIELAQPLAARFGASVMTFVNLGHIDAVGDYELKLTVSDVNGVPNNDPVPTAVMPIKIYPFVAVNRPLVEEYTGLWCGWCPKGYVAMETMREEYPDRFVGIAYHNDDALTTGVVYPNSPGGYPAGYINRSRFDIGKLYTMWPNTAAAMAKVGVECEASWANDAHSVVEAVSKVRFMDNESKVNYRIEYVLIADDLRDPAWRQYNAYSPEPGQEPKEWDEMPGELGRIFTHGGKNISGLTFNDVPLAASAIGGVPGSVPASAVAGEIYSHTYRFDISNLTDVSRTLLNKTDKLRVVAIIVDGNNHPVNCASSAYIYGESGVASAEMTEREIVSTRWYDISGRALSGPAKGLNIRIDTYSDGSSKAIRERVK